jgi:hypothetical protein
LEPSAARFVETVEAERAGRRLNLPSLQHGGPRYPTLGFDRQLTETGGFSFLALGFE